MSRVFTKEWFYATLIRMIRTFAEAAIAYIGTGAVVLNDVNWIGVLSAGAMGAAMSFLLALAGLPEVKQEEDDPWHGE
jgi:hypothetical protein